MVKLIKEIELKEANLIKKLMKTLKEEDNVNAPDSKILKLEVKKEMMKYYFYKQKRDCENIIIRNTIV